MFERKVKHKYPVLRTDKKPILYQIKKPSRTNGEGSYHCLPYKKSYLGAVVSVLIPVVSVPIPDVSTGVIAAVSTVEVFTVSSVASLSDASSLHATKAPIANTKRSFFIVPVF